MNNRKLYKAGICSLYIILFFTCCALFFMKTDFMVDELLTYNLSNQDRWFHTKNGKIYTPANTPYMDAMTSDGKLHLGQIWEQQTNDTHPPFYYLLVHMVCMAFPGKFSIAYAGVINIIFILLTLFMVRKIFKLLIHDELVELILSAVFILTAGILNIIPLLRMYVMAIFFITAIAYHILKNIEHFGIREFAIAAIIVISGALTHYYFLIYAFFISFFFGLIMLGEKRFKEFFVYVISMAISAGATIAIFPAIITHLFKQGRGSQSIENIKSSNLAQCFSEYIKIISRELFGGLFGIILIAIVVMIIIYLVKTLKAADRRFDKISIYRYICLLAPVLCYLLLVAKSAPFRIDRYASPIYAVTIAGVWSLLYTCIKSVVTNAKIRNGVFAAFAIIVIVLGLVKSNWGYLYLDGKERLAESVIYGEGTQAIVVYDKAWRTNAFFLEISNCESSVFYKAQDYAKFKEKAEKNPLPDKIALIIVGLDANEILNSFLTEHGEYTIVKDNGQWQYGHSYYLVK